MDTVAIPYNFVVILDQIFQTYIYLNVKYFVYISDKYIHLNVWSEWVDNYFKCFVIIWKDGWQCSTKRAGGGASLTFKADVMELRPKVISYRRIKLLF